MINKPEKGAIKIFKYANDFFELLNNCLYFALQWKKYVFPKAIEKVLFFKIKLIPFEICLK